MTFPRSTPPKDPAGRRSRPVGPKSNTGQKSSTGEGRLAAPTIDWCAVSFPAGSLEKFCDDPEGRSWHKFVFEVYGLRGVVSMSAIEEKRWNFFRWSAVLVDETNTLCGRFGLNEKGEAHLSLTGQGCKHVQDWARVRSVVETLGAHITRVDIAVDDFVGAAVNTQTFLNMIDEGEFNNGGRPPTCQYIDDLGSGKGKTLYIGQRGYKQLCIYEKGKQLGDPDSSYCRVELRLYNKHHVIDPAALTDPSPFFAGAYECLAAFIGGEIQKLEAKELQSEPTIVALVSSLERQVGTAFGLLRRSLGDEQLTKVIAHEIAREGRPGRFKSYVGDLEAQIRAHFSNENEERNDEDQDSRHQR